jgi:hypothetical protein
MVDNSKCIRYWIQYEGNEKYLEEIDDFIIENDNDDTFVFLNLNDRLKYEEVKLIVDHTCIKEFICTGKMRYNIIDASDDVFDNYDNINDLHYNIDQIFEKTK